MEGYGAGGAVCPTLVGSATAGRGSRELEGRRLASHFRVLAEIALRAGAHAATAVTRTALHDDVHQVRGRRFRLSTANAAIQKVRLARTLGTLVTRQESRPF